MNPLFHIISVLPLCYVLYPEIGFVNTLFLFLGGWAFDVDHYLYYIFKYKSFSLKDCYEFHSPFAKERDLLHIFHIVEFYFIVFIISIFIEPVFFLLIGLLYHQSFDVIQLLYFKIKGEPKANNCRAVSLIRWIKRNYLIK